MHQIEQNILNQTNLFESNRYKTTEHINKTSSYLPIPHCLSEYIITNTKLSSTDKLIFFYLYSRSYFNHGKNKKRSITASLRSISDTLYISKAQTLASQKKLEQLGLFTIKRQKNKYNQSKPNLITPLVPDDLFVLLNKSDNRIGADSDFHKPESNLDYLERTKQFINFNYGLLKYFLEHSKLNSASKILAIDLFSMWYKYHLSSSKTSNFKLQVNYKQLVSRQNCSLKSISNRMIELEEQGVISRMQIFAKNGEEQNARHDKSIWEITFNFPKWYKDTQAPNQLHTDTLYNKTIEDELLKSDEQNREFYSTHTEEVNNLESILHNNSGIIDELITKLSEFKNSFKQNITSCSNLLDSFHNKNEQKTDSNFSLEDDSINNSDITANTNESAVCYKNDPGSPKNDPLYNRDIIIKNFKSNLRGNAKVIFNNFLKKIGVLSESQNNQGNQKKKAKAFSITSELIRRKLIEIPKDKADKARKYAYSLISKKLAKGYAASLDKHELAKQLIFHITTWRPTKFSNLNKEQEIDTALSVAWKAIANGTWKIPLGYAKAQILNYEFISHKNKYKNDGILSSELYLLEKETDKLFEGYSNLTEILKREVLEEKREGEIALQLENYKQEHINPFEQVQSELCINEVQCINPDEYNKNLYDESRLISQFDKLDDLSNYDTSVVNSYEQNNQTSIIKKESFMEKSLSLLETELHQPIVYFGRLEWVISDDDGNLHILFDIATSDEFLQTQKNCKMIEELNDKSVNNCLLSNQGLDLQFCLSEDSKQNGQIDNTGKVKEINYSKNNTLSSEQFLSRFKELDISYLKDESRLYRIYGTQTNHLAIEGINTKTFFGVLKEMEHCPDGKLRVILRN